MLKVVPVLMTGLLVIAGSACSQTAEQETLGGADRHETTEQDRGYLLGDWGGLRGQLGEIGVNLDVQYISDSLWGSKSGPPSQFEIWNRVRATVDIDLGALLHWDGTYFHATGLWQGGGNLGERLVWDKNRAIAGDDLIQCFADMVDLHLPRRPIVDEAKENFRMCGNIHQIDSVVDRDANDEFRRCAHVIELLRSQREVDFDRRITHEFAWETVADKALVGGLDPYS